MNFEEIQKAIEIAIKVLGVGATLGQASDWFSIEENAKRLREQQEPEEAKK